MTKSRLKSVLGGGPMYADEFLPDPSVMHQEVQTEPVDVPGMLRAEVPTEMADVKMSQLPEIPSEPAISAAPEEEDLIGRRITRLERQLGQENDPYAGMDFKHKLLAVGLKAAPMVIGGALSGEWGGAAAGLDEGLKREDEMRMTRAKGLQAQLEGAYNEQTRATERRQAREQFRQKLEQDERQHREALGETKNYHEGVLKNTAENPKHKTTDAFDTDGKPMKFQFNPETERYDIPVGPPVPKSSTHTRYEVKMIEGQPVAVDRMDPNGKFYDEDSSDAPPEAVAALQPYLRAHKKHLAEEIDAEGRRENAKEQAKAAVSVAQKKKVFEPALDADKKLAVMADAMKHPTPQNDVAMLFNHIGMTGSAQKGFRMTQAEIDRAIRTRSLPENVIGMLQQIGVNPDTLAMIWNADPKKLPPGGFLTPQQRKDMYDLGVKMRNIHWNNARREAKFLGIEGEPVQMNGLPALGEAAADTPDGDVIEYVRDPKTKKLVPKTGGR